MLKDLLLDFKKWDIKRFLPTSSYRTIYQNLDIKFGKEKTQLFEIFLKDNIFEDFYFTCYGKSLMRMLVRFRSDKWIRSLGKRCIDKCLQNNNHLVSKITLLSIIFDEYNFPRLSENHPEFLANILSKIGFVAPSTKVNPESASSHLSNSNINMFTQFGSALIASYYMIITGDSTPISSWISSEDAVIIELISNEKNDIAYLVLKSE
ncbi:35401_t:CDS:2, partial [Racocetra persica]